MCRNWKITVVHEVIVENGTPKDDVGRLTSSIFGSVINRRKTIYPKAAFTRYRTNLDPGMKFVLFSSVNTVPSLFWSGYFCVYTVPMRRTRAHAQNSCRENSKWLPATKKGNLPDNLIQNQSQMREKRTLAGLMNRWPFFFKSSCIAYKA